MIADQVETNCTHREYIEMEKWCNVNIGNKAIWKDNVNEHNPWTVDAPFRCYTWYFARERDATMFRMRWL